MSLCDVIVSLIIGHYLPLAPPPLYISSRSPQIDGCLNVFLRKKINIIITRKSTVSYIGPNQDNQTSNKLVARGWFGRPNRT